MLKEADGLKNTLIVTGRITCSFSFYKSPQNISPKTAQLFLMVSCLSSSSSAKLRKNIETVVYRVSSCRRR
jgi:hypothetical protein